MSNKSTAHRQEGADATILDSGERQEFDSGAVRDTQGGKGRFDLVINFAMLELAKHMEQGCAKYGDRNFEKGMPVSRFVDSMMRHTFKFMVGETDERHDRALAWNAMGLLYTLAAIERGFLPKSLDDRPVYEELASFPEDFDPQADIAGAMAQKVAEEISEKMAEAVATKRKSTESPCSFHGSDFKSFIKLNKEVAETAYSIAIDKFIENLFCERLPVFPAGTDQEIIDKVIMKLARKYGFNLKRKPILIENLTPVERYNKAQQERMDEEVKQESLKQEPVDIMEVIRKALKENGLA